MKGEVLVLIRNIPGIREISHTIAQSLEVALCEDPKARFLASRGALHPHPERVRDPLFRGSDFFDPRDLVQVRYEMLRRHLVDGRVVGWEAVP